MVTMTNQERDAAEQAYNKAYCLIFKVCKKFQNTFGGDMEELLANANTHFLRAYGHGGFDASKGCWNTWMTTAVWRGLVRDHVPHTERRGKQQVVGFGVDADGRQPGLDNLESRVNRIEALLADVGDDAATVVRLTLDPPPGVKLLAGKRPAAKGMLAALSEYLVNLGWTTDRIAETYAELRDVVCG